MNPNVNPEPKSKKFVIMLGVAVSLVEFLGCVLLSGTVELISLVEFYVSLYDDAVPHKRTKSPITEVMDFI